MHKEVMLKALPEKGINHEIQGNSNSAKIQKNIDLQKYNVPEIIKLKDIKIGKIKPHIKNLKKNCNENDEIFKMKKNNCISTVPLTPIPLLTKNQEEVSEYINDFVKIMKDSDSDKDKEKENENKRNKEDILEETTYKDVAKSIIKILGKNDEDSKLEIENLKNIEQEQKNHLNKKYHESIAGDLKKQVIDKIGIEKNNQIYSFLKNSTKQNEKNNVQI